MRLLLVFKRFSIAKSVGTKLRVDLMNTYSASAYESAVKRQESVLFDVNESDKLDSKVSYLQKLESSKSLS